MLFSAHPNIHYRTFLSNRKFRRIPCYIKRHSRANDMHSREDVDCHKRPRGAREYARAHSFYGASEQAACSRFCVGDCVERPILKAPGSVL